MFKLLLEMLKVYEDVLGVTFKPAENPHVWHDEVKQFSVYDAVRQVFLSLSIHFQTL